MSLVAAHQVPRQQLCRPHRDRRPDEAVRGALPGKALDFPHLRLLWKFKKVCAHGVVQVVTPVTFTVFGEPDPDRCPNDNTGYSPGGMVEVGCKLALPGQRSGMDILDGRDSGSQFPVESSATVLSFLGQNVHDAFWRHEVAKQ